jgi:uncharacterized protein YaaN involved in tellurite resistance
MTTLPATMDPTSTSVTFSAEERTKIDQLKSVVDPTSHHTILSIGAAAEKNLVLYTDMFLDRIGSTETGEAHEELVRLRLVTEQLNADRLKGGQGFFGRLFFRAKVEIVKFVERFKTAREQIDGIVQNLEERMDQTRLGLITLDKLFEKGEEHLAEIELAIQATRELMEEWTTQIPEMEAESAANPNDAALRQRVADTKTALSLLDSKRTNLEKSKSIAFLHLPSIRQAQRTGQMLIQEIHAMITHAVPAWKTSMVINIEQLRQRVGLESLAAASAFTDSQITALARSLDENTMAIHEQTKRGISSVDAIVEATTSLVATLDKVETLDKEAAKMRAEGRKRLDEARRELTKRGAM